MDTIKHKKDDNFLKQLIRYFVQGMIIIAPIALTGYVLFSIFNIIDGWLRPVVAIPGLGFITVIAFILLVGWLSSYIIMDSVINFFDHWLERTPGIKIIYSSIKDFFNAFTGDKKKFTKPVLANIFAADVWIVGFITDEEMEKFHMGHEMVSVYVPHSYAFSGQLYILPKDKIKLIDTVTPGDAMKYTVTGGVVQTAEDRK